MDSKAILAALRARHSDPGSVFVPELSYGLRGGRVDRWGNDKNNERALDAFVVLLRNSRDYARLAYEIKVTRSDFLSELRDPSKRRPALEIANQFYFAAPKGLISPQELPEECGLVEVSEIGETRMRVKAPWRQIADPTPRLLATLLRFVVDQDADASELKRLAAALKSKERESRRYIELYYEREEQHRVFIDLFISWAEGEGYVRDGRSNFFFGPDGKRYWLDDLLKVEVKRHYGL